MRNKTKAGLRRSQRPKSVAAIDLGTNSCRMIIVDDKGKSLYRNAISTRMGEGMSLNNSFTDDAIKRGVKAFSAFSKIMYRCNVNKYRAIATAACRASANGSDFINTVKKKTRINIEVIDGLEEAKLNLKGALLNAKEEKSKYVVVYDMGGGSTEITLATREIEPKFLASVSIPWGARNASEKFDLAEYDEKKAEALAEEIKKYTSEFLQKANLAECDGDITFMATSSAPLRLASMVNNRKEYDRNWADGKRISTSDIDKVISFIRTQSVEDMKINPNIGTKRAEIFQSACVIFSQIYKDLGAKELIVSLKSAVDAIIMELQNGKNSNS